MPEPHAPIPQEFRQVFRELVLATQAQHVRTDPDVVRIYFETLRDFSIDVVRTSARNLRRTTTFFPSTGEWFQAAQSVLRGSHSAGTLGEPEASGEWPYDPSEPPFTEAELENAREWRTRGSHDTCPHTPGCPTVAVCVDEIAWYLRHRVETA